MNNRVTTLFFLLICLSSHVFGQEKEIPKEFNYFEIVKEYKEQLAKEKIDTTHDNLLVKLSRFESFWVDRIPGNGDLREYPKVMSQIHLKSLRNSNSKSSCGADCLNCCVQSNWTYFGPKFIEINKKQNLGKILSLWVNPVDDNHILAGAEGGVWKTINGGADWTNISDFCFPGIGIFSIAVHPTNSDIIYAGTGYANGVSHTDHHYGYGLFKSSDGGNSWLQMPINYGTPEKGLVQKVIIHPTLFSNVYATVGHKVFKTINNGGSWSEVFGDAENPNNLPLYDLEIVVNGTVDHLYASSFDKHASYGCIVPPAPGTYNWGNPAPGQYCETRYSASAWEFKSNQNTASILSSSLLNPSLPGFNPVSKLVSVSITSSTVYIGIQSNNNASPSSPPSHIDIYKKPISSTSWSLQTSSVANGLNYGYSFPFFVSTANENVMYYGGHGINKSINGGTTFNQLHSYWCFVSNPNCPHVDHRAMAPYSFSNDGNSDVFIDGNDGGISKTFDGGVVMQNLNNDDLQLTQFHGISNSEILPNLVYGGTQDNGTFDNSNQNWRNYPYGDGYDAVSDAVNPMIAYMTLNSCSLRKTINGGSNWGVTPAPECANNAQLYIDANNELYFGKKQLHKDNGTGGVSWTTISAITNTTGNIVDIEMSDNSSIKYIAYSNPVWGSANRGRKVYKFDNAGCVSGCDLSTNLPGIDWAGITDIATDELGENLWVSFGGLWDINKKIYHYKNGTWTELGEGLENVPTASIEYYKNGILFLGTDNGVYYRDSNMSKWERFSCNLPNTMIADLEINYSANKLRVATHSRGIWETSINYKLGNDLFCNSSLQASARVTPSFPISYIPSLQNNQIVNVSGRNANVSINLSNACSGASCCDETDDISWEIYRDNVLYSQGGSPNISFSGSFRSGWWLFGQRHTYKVEVEVTCGQEDCGRKTYYFNGI